MKQLCLKHERYQHGDYLIDIFDENNCYEAYLKHKDYGISVLMFGLLKTDVNFDEFLEIVEANLPDYIQGYIEDYQY